MKFFRPAIIVVSLILAAGALYLLDLPHSDFDRQEALEAGADYQPRIIRDAYGVPHIYGPRNEDVAFGLAYAHAEDDLATIADVLLFSRGTLARKNGRSGAVTDYLVGALAITNTVHEQYEKALSDKTRALTKAYAAGINFYCAQNRGACSPSILPVTGQDIVAGFSSRTPFFFGLEEILREIFEGDPRRQAMIDTARHAVLNASPDTPIGSNAMAVAGDRSADGHTRLFVNSHQPFEGPVAWYETRLKSDEGWDMIGPVFPGSPVILHGTGPQLGWAHTVNKPDLVDIFELTVDNPKSPKQYKMDGEWRDLVIEKISFRVRLFGPFSLPVTRKAYFSVHGPVLINDHGAFAISIAGRKDIRAIEQWYQMNLAQNFDEWRDAMRINAIPSFNVVYGDREGNIGYFYNAKLPIRDSNIDWSGVVPGDRSDLLWSGYRGFDAVPQIVNPASGYVVNANHSPFDGSGAGDNPDRADFPTHFGISDNSTNRGLRLQALYGADPSITEEEFFSYKMDNTYAEDSRVMALVRTILAEPELADDPARAVLAQWDGAVTVDNRSAALAIFTAQRVRGFLLNDENIVEADVIVALRSVADELEQGFGRIDPEWGEVVRLQRGSVDLPVNGGPDTVRAIYGNGDLSKGAIPAIAGDTHIVYADWPADGGGQYPKIRVIHQYGSATLDESSPYYADQAPLFAAEQYRTPPMTLEAVIAEATSDTRFPLSPN